MAGSSSSDANFLPLEGRVSRLDVAEPSLSNSLGEPCQLSDSFDPTADFFCHLKPGDIVGERYRVQSLIGQGGMGMVYKVEQIFLGKELALKILHSRTASDVSVRRFQHEARAAFGIDHPSLIAVHDFGLLEQRIPFLVMDYVKGRSLADRVKMQGTLSVQEAVPLFLGICFGLGYAHEHGVIHRDIKPSNIMLVDGLSAGEDGCVKIVDFGIAKFTQNEMTELQALTRTGEVFGSPLYMSPEQCSGTSVDQRSDIYSLGCVFFEMLTGTTPFVGANALSTMMQHMGENPPSLKEASMGKDFPPVLQQIVSRMLAKRAGDRYQNLSQVAADLAALERTLVDPVLLSTAVLKLDKAEDRGEQSGLVSLPKPVVYTATALIIGISACLSSLITTAQLGAVNHEGEPVAPAVPSTGKHLEEAKQLVNSLETKTGRPSVSDRAIFAAVKTRSSYGRLSLRFLDLCESNLNTIAGASWVEHLDLMGCGIDNSKLYLLRHLPNLAYITLSNSTLDDDGAIALSRFPHLLGLNVSWSNITKKSIAYLTQMPSLRYLEIGGTQCDLSTIKLLADDARLLNLDLRGIFGVNDESFAPMVNSQLQFLNVESVDIGDKAAEYFAKMPNLMVISIGGTKITPKGVDALLKGSRVKTVLYTETSSLSRNDILGLIRKYPCVRFAEGFERGGDNKP
ncbi:MAG TPA: protein kinase [Candidatus Melainabacteria bacterium]|nr:protein kinase [Candidatus Melainabacteria bacterium]